MENYLLPIKAGNFIARILVPTTMSNKFGNFGVIVQDVNDQIFYNKAITMNCCCVLVCIQFIWTVDTIGLMVVFGMKNIAMFFMTSLQK